jgi:hypothetical protein
MFNVFLIYMNINGNAVLPRKLTKIPMLVLLGVGQFCLLLTAGIWAFPEAF